MKVQISDKQYCGLDVYHTTDCQAAKQTDTTVTIDREKAIERGFELCDYCSDDSVSRKTNHETTCPYCNQSITRLPNHLPCQGSQAINAD